MKSILVIISTLAFYLTCNSQTSSNKVRLIKWSSEACDNTFDPYRLKTRISSIEQWRNLDNILDVEFYPNGNIRKIELVRDEPTRDGVGLGARYSWHWNDKMNLIEFPKSWKEPFPWTRFP